MIKITLEEPLREKLSTGETIERTIKYIIYSFLAFSIIYLVVVNSDVFADLNTLRIPFIIFLIALTLFIVSQAYFKRKTLKSHDITSLFLGITIIVILILMLFEVLLLSRGIIMAILVIATIICFFQFSKERKEK